MTNIPFFRHKNQKNGENFDFLKYICADFMCMAHGYKPPKLIENGKD